MADGDELPGYTGRKVAAPTPVYRSEHKYSLETKGRPWLFIFVKSRSPNATSLPFFLQADTVAGRVELDLEKAESFKSISIAIQAGATAVGQEEQLFLELNQDLWPAANDKSSKLAKGKYSWPFTFTLPAKVTPADAKGLQIEAPPSFTERASPAYIDYRAVVTVKRGAFKMNQTLTTSLAYLPLTQPEPPSPLRQLAYQEGGDLVGPEGDPQGWKVLRPVKFKGKLFDAKEVEAECTLAIATPLAFTIGSPIPLILTLKSEDELALDTLASSKAIKLHLVRSIALGSDAMEEKAERRSNTFFLSSAGQGYFWPSMEGAKETGIRTMRGELEVNKGIKPSFHFPRFTVRYSLDLLPFAITGFASLGTEPGKALLSEPVKIMTKHVPGVTARSYAPPGYEKPEENDYNSAVGYLENGNQRFYHHGGFA
ncbi:hypothetical protein DFH08DRAFT_910474 [Mycena albidolilacea]|uniref:Arrestin-like N-terminal domain-containing protein n=1 Tax=Mycena albidolilacea TaxID=1033008 RepID=A0AAD7F428_9AGAR|nr:hypothetical protein DFH08DRAFT_910474 [Mycena albidolilacea]